MSYSIYSFDIINTKIGIVARQKLEHAELAQYNQIWLRKSPEKWEYSSFVNNKARSPVSPGFLEALYRNQEQKQGLPFEDGW